MLRDKSQLCAEMLRAVEADALTALAGENPAIPANLMCMWRNKTLIGQGMQEASGGWKLVGDARSTRVAMTFNRNQRAD